jgi:hypothetical protein
MLPATNRKIWRPANVLNKSRTPLPRQYGESFRRSAPLAQFVISRMPSRDYVAVSV